MKVVVKVYDIQKYNKHSHVIAEKSYNIEDWEVKTMTDDEIYARGFDEFDPNHEYLILKFKDDESATFRNSFCDVFKY